MRTRCDIWPLLLGQSWSPPQGANDEHVGDFFWRRLESQNQHRSGKHVGCRRNMRELVSQRTLQHFSFCLWKAGRKGLKIAEVNTSELLRPQSSKKTLARSLVFCHSGVGQPKLASTREEASIQSTCFHSEAPRQTPLLWKKTSAYTKVQGCSGETP